MPELKAHSTLSSVTQPGLSAEISQPAAIVEVLTTVAELEQLRQLLIQQNTRIQQLEARLTQLAEPLPPVAKLERPEKVQSRRKMLRRVGLAAVGLSAATSAALISSPEQRAQAASGDILLIGNSNVASTTTYLSQTSNTIDLASGVANFNPILWSDYNATAKTTPATPVGTLNVGVAGTSSGSGGVGGYFQGDRAQLALQPTTSAGQPSDATHQRGELYLDSNGKLYLCAVSGNGSSVMPVWGQLAPLVFLTNPLRVVGPNSGSAYASVSTSASAPSYFRMEGTWTDTNSAPYASVTATIPSAATGVFGTITVVTASSNGYLSVFPADQGTPIMLSVAYQTTNFVSSSAFACRLGTIPSGTDAGKKGIAIFAFSSGVTIAIDIVGYYL